MWPEPLASSPLSPFTAVDATLRSFGHHQGLELAQGVAGEDRRFRLASDPSPSGAEIFVEPPFRGRIVVNVSASAARDDIERHQYWAVDVSDLPVALAKALVQARAWLAEEGASKPADRSRSA